MKYKNQWGTILEMRPNRSGDLQIVTHVREGGDSLCVVIRRADVMELARRMRTYRTPAATCGSFEG